jgi:hypothetical protein
MKSAQSQEILAIFLKILTPGPLNSPVKFSWRVITSWIVTGWAIGFLFMLPALASGGLPDLGAALGVVLFLFPIVLIVYGLIGLGIDLIRGKKLSRTGWVWYIHPIVSIFWIALGILGFIVGLAGLSLPKQPTSRISYKKLLELISRMSSLEFVSEFGDPVIEDQLNDIKLKPVERTAIETVKQLAISQPRQLLGKALAPQELDILTTRIGIPTLEQIHGVEVIKIPSHVL